MEKQNMLQDYFVEDTLTCPGLDGWGLHGPNKQASPEVINPESEIHACVARRFG